MNRKYTLNSTREMKDQVNQIKELCNQFVDFFDDLKTKGNLSEKEYIKHTSLKKKFLNDNIKD